MSTSILPRRELQFYRSACFVLENTPFRGHTEILATINFGNQSRDALFSLPRSLSSRLVSLLHRRKEVFRVAEEDSDDEE